MRMMNGSDNAGDANGDNCMMPNESEELNMNEGV